LALAARAAHDLADTATTRDLLALLDGYPPGCLAPMQRAERDLARARLIARDGDPAVGPALAAAIAGLRQHSTPNGMLDHAAHLAARGEAEAATAATGEATDGSARAAAVARCDLGGDHAPWIVSPRGSSPVRGVAPTTTPNHRPRMSQPSTQTSTPVGSSRHSCHRSS
jgi:hypothetical protein